RHRWRWGQEHCVPLLSAEWRPGRGGGQPDTTDNTAIALLHTNTHTHTHTHTCWLLRPSGIGLSCGGGCFTSDKVTSREQDSSSALFAHTHIHTCRRHTPHDT